MLDLSLALESLSQKLKLILGVRGEKPRFMLEALA